MGKAFETPWLRLKRRRIRRNRVEGLDKSDALHHHVAEPLFRAGIFRAAIAEKVGYSDGMTEEPLPRQYHFVFALLQGCMHLTLDGRITDLVPGMFACCPVGTPFHCEALANSTWWIYFCMDDTPAWQPMKRRGPYIGPWEETIIAFLHLREALDAKDSNDPVAVRRGRGCARYLASLLRDQMMAGHWTSARHTQALQELLRRIESSPGSPWKLADMAQSLQMSVSAMCKLFRKDLGVSPGKLVVQQRMRAAANQLAQTDRPIKAIAEEAGYESLHSFTRLFARHTGCPPGRYRDRFRDQD